MFIFKVNSVLNARVLELDDELKEAYNKYDNLKSELVVLFISFRFWYGWYGFCFLICHLVGSVSIHLSNISSLEIMSCEINRVKSLGPGNMKHVKEEEDRVWYNMISMINMIDVMWYDMIWYDMTWYDMIGQNMMWYDMWYVICDMWYMIYDIWYMIYDIWYMMYDVIWWYDANWYDTKWYDMMWYDTWHVTYDVWYDMIWYDMIWYDMIWYMIYDIWYMIWYDMIWYDMIWYDVMWCEIIWYDMIWYDMIWYDMIWYDMKERKISFLFSIRYDKKC